MTKDLTTVKGTIAYLFTQNSDKLWSCGNDLNKMKGVALNLLEDESLTDKQAVFKAKELLGKSSGSRFMSILVTYMTGQKVS